MRHNLLAVRRCLDSPRVDAARARPYVWAVIKANAYGHGILNGVQGFAAADGLAMLDLNEAVRCREAGWNGPLLLLEGFFEPADIPVLDLHSISTTLHCSEQLDMLEKASPGRPLDAMVKLDSGMNRLGFQPGEYRQAYGRALALQQRGVLGALGRMTHFARADDDAQATARQIAVFDEAAHGLPGRASLCNSAATLTDGLWARCVPGGEQWVRPGICLYGSSPFDERPAAGLGLRPVMTLRSRLINVHVLRAGASVGYGYTYTAPRDTRVGVVACGYADGYPRHAPTGTPICVGGVMTRTLGRISMDMLAVDLDPAPGAAVGTEVVLWGQGGPSVDDVARASGTVGYELLCALAPRVPVQVEQG
jgi:alanine racemase